jgi:hypothetical protein
MTVWVNIFRTIQASNKYKETTSGRFPGKGATTACAKSSVCRNRITEMGRLTLRPFKGFYRKYNTCGECCARLSPAQTAMAM